MTVNELREMLDKIVDGDVRIYLSTVRQADGTDKYPYRGCHDVRLISGDMYSIGRIILFDKPSSVGYGM